MRVRLIQESSGFGYSGKVVNWIVEEEENLGKIQKLEKGLVVEIPEKVAKGIFNLVDVETGKIPSKRFNILISEADVERIYKESNKEKVSETRVSLKTIFKEEIVTEAQENLNNLGSTDSKIKPLIEENE